MSERSAALLAEVLKLSEHERSQLADEIWDSLDPEASDIDSMNEVEFAAELNRRYEESLHDPSVGISMEEVNTTAQ